MRMMVLAVICLTTISVSGCGSRLLAPAQDLGVRQSLADMRVVNDPQVAPDANTREVNSRLANEMRLAMGIEMSELPTARVSVEEYKTDTLAASKKNIKQIDDTPIPSGWTALIGSGLTIAAMLIIGISAKGTTGTPLGPVFAIAQQLLTATHPRDAATLTSVVTAIEEYKTHDPMWEKNPVMILLGKTLTTVQKDYIKTKATQL